jgi:hypothetical protein
MLDGPTLPPDNPRTKAMSIAWNEFTPASALIGGAMIGGAADAPAATAYAGSRERRRARS